MAIADVHMTALQIVNEVQRKLNLNETTNFTANKHATILLDFLNDIVDDLNDYGDWQEMIREVEITAAASTGQYKVKTSSEMQRIHEVVWANDIAPLEVRPIEDIRRLQRVRSFGKPRHFSIVGVSGATPFIRVHPIPTSATINAETTGSAHFDILYYKKLRHMVTADSTATAVLPYPGRVLVQGVFALALLEEYGDRSAPEVKANFSQYEKMKREAQNRFNSDTGGDNIRFVPTGGRYT